MESVGQETSAQEYFLAVEERFARLRGRPLLLSPRDVSLVKQWHDAGVPLHVVERALERFFEREALRSRPRRRPATLEYCERDVFEVWEDWKTSRLGALEPGVGTPEGAPDPLASHLAAAAAKLSAARARSDGEHRARLSAELERAERELARLAASGLAAASLEPELAALEASLVAAARAELEGPALTGIIDAVRREIAPHVGGMDGTARELLEHKALDRALLARFAVPRLALFAF